MRRQFDFAFYSLLTLTFEASIKSFCKRCLIDIVSLPYVLPTRATVRTRAESSRRWSGRGHNRNGHYI